MPRWIAMLILVVMGQAVTGLVLAVECEDYSTTARIRDVRNLGEPIHDLALDNGRLLVGHQTGLVRLIDTASNPAFPWALDALTLSSADLQLAVSGTAVVVAGSHPSTLQRLSIVGDTIEAVGVVLPLAAPPVDVAWANGMAYVLIEDTDNVPWSSTLVTVDFSDPDLPVITDQQGMPYPSVALDLNEGMLGVVSIANPNLTLLDLTTPAAPTFLGSWHGGALARDVLIRAGKAWVVGNTKLTSIDVSDPTSPIGDESFADPLGWVHVAEAGEALLVLRETIQGGEEGVALFGPSVAAGPVGSLRIHGEAIATTVGWAYVGEGQTLNTIEIRNALEPVPLGGLPTESLDDDVLRVASSGDLGVALIETRDGGIPISRLWLMDMQAGGDPVRRGSLDLPTGVVSLDVLGSIVAVGLHNPVTSSGSVHLIDALDRDHPVELSSLSVAGSPEVVAFRNRVLHVAIRSVNSGVSHLFVPFLIDNPAAPVSAPPLYLPFPPLAHAYDQVNQLMYLVGDGLFDIYDVSDPLYPVLVDDYITNFAHVSAVVNEAGELWLGADTGWLVRADLSTPGIINLVDATWLPGTPISLHADGAKIWAACGDLALVDVSVAGFPELIGHVGAGDTGAVMMTEQGPMTASGSRGVLQWPDHCQEVAVWYLGMHAEALEHEALIRWNVAGVASVDDFRVFAGRNRQRQVQVEQDDDGFFARDWRARDRVLYTLELRTDSGWQVLDEVYLRIPAGEIPAVTDLGTPHPNPFNPVITIPFALARTGPVSVEVVDAAGRRIATLAHGSWPYGAHEVVWEGRDDQGKNAASGTYFIRLQSDEITQSRKVMLVR